MPFYIDHRRCGDRRAGVDERSGESVVWIECHCSAMLARPVSPAEPD